MNNKLSPIERVSCFWHLLVLILLVAPTSWVFSTVYAKRRGLDVKKTIKDDYSLLFKIVKLVFKGLVVGKVG